MKKRIFISITLALIVVMLCSTMAMSAEKITSKNLKVFFRNIKINVNNKIYNPSTTEPFIYNDRVYVPIRMVSEALGKNVEWDNANSTVIINDGAELQQLKQQNEFLKIQVSELQKALKDLTDSYNKKNKQKTIDDLESYLKDEYSKWNGIKFSYRVKGDKDDIDLTIEFDLDEYKSKWDKLDEDDVEDWLEDIYDYIEDEFPDASFEGKIRDSNKRDTLVEFNASRGRLKINFSSKDTDDDLEYNLKKLYGKNLKTYDKAFGSLTADFDVEIDKSNKEINVTITIDTSEYEDEWDDVRRTSAAEEWIEDIVEYIQDEYSKYDIIGAIENHKGREEATFKTTSSGRVKISW